MKGFIYIMTNKNNTVLYTGITSDLRERASQHILRKHPFFVDMKFTFSPGNYSAIK
jgi:putative endonuclease